MKVQRNHAYNYTTKEGKVIPHYKYNVVLPEQAIEKLGWRGDEELDWDADGKNLILKPVKTVKAVRRVEPVKRVEESKATP